MARLALGPAVCNLPANLDGSQLGWRIVPIQATRSE